MRKRLHGHPTSPLERPRVSEIYNYTINDEWPYYNTSEIYNVTIREPENVTYDYNGPQILYPVNYYSKPSFTNAFCTKGPDDVQHN